MSNSTIAIAKFVRPPFFSGKKILATFLMIACTVFAYAQKNKEQLLPPEMPRSEDNSQVYYKEVVTEDGVDKMELFKRAGNWFHTFYKNPTGIVEQTD